MHSRCAPALLLAVLLAAPSARAGSCYDENDLPAVTNLEQHRGELRAFLGGALYDDGADAFPTLVLEEPDQWRPSSPSRCGAQACGYTRAVRDEAERCKARIPPIVLTEKEARKLRPDLKKGVRLEQKIGACVEADGWLWFGIAFTEDRGVGGLGRFQPSTGKLEVRRPALLRSASVTRLAVDTTQVWAGTESLADCIGSKLAEGLVRYDWRSQQARTYKGSDDEGPCGFLIHALAFRGGGLWVATDLGLSRWDRVHDGWEHTVFARTEEGLTAEQTTCPRLYRRLLPTLSKTPGSTVGYGSARDQFEDALRGFKPGLASEILRPAPQ